MSGFYNELVDIAKIKKGMSILLPDSGCGLDLIFERIKSSEIRIHLVEKNGEHVKTLMNKYYGGKHDDIVFHHPEEEYSFLANDIRITKYDFMKFGRGFGDYDYDRIISFVESSPERLLHMFKLTKNGGVMVSPIARETVLPAELEKCELIESEYLIQDFIRILRVTK